MCSDLNSIDIEDAWDRSGPSRYGYTEPWEAAYQLLEEAINPHRNEMKRLHSLGMFSEEMHYCMGIASGLQQFGNEAEGDILELAEDAPGDMAEDIISERKKECTDPKLKAEMTEFEKLLVN